MLQRATSSRLGAPSSKSNKSTEIASSVTKAHKEQERREDESRSLQVLSRSHQLTLPNNGGFELKRVESEREECMHKGALSQVGGVAKRGRKKGVKRYMYSLSRTSRYLKRYRLKQCRPIQPVRTGSNQWERFQKWHTG